MRIKIVQKPPPHVLDGIDLSRFEVGEIYEVGNTLAPMFLAEKWAIPVDDPLTSGERRHKATSDVSRGITGLAADAKRKEKDNL